MVLPPGKMVLPPCKMILPGKMVLPPQCLNVTVINMLWE